MPGRTSKAKACPAPRAKKSDAAAGPGASQRARPTPHSEQAIVIAVAVDRAAFVVEARSGLCAVFCQNGGPPVLGGDVLEGPVLARGVRRLQHVDGACCVVGDSGPVSREEALSLLHGRTGLR